jgi:serine/threonine-protein kinase
VSAAPSEIAVGTVIADTYEVTGLLGHGGMGAVWAAQHRRLPGKRVAVKVLLGATTDAESLARFRREAEIASRIGHPNIIEVLDFHTLPSGTPYMILEFLDGESLASRLRRGPLPLEAALEIARQVGSALHAAHRAQVVHRDLKPDNIFLVPSDAGGVLADRVKVLDFGISKIRGSSTVQTQESALLGTPQYMSPEQAYGKNRTIDQRTDVWALGTIVYEMLVGAPAFSGETLAQVILSIVNDPAPSLSGHAGVPDKVAHAVDRALKKDIAERWPDVASFIAELTGRPLQTLDRQAGAKAAVDPLASTMAPAPAPSPSLPHAATQAAPVSVGTQPRGEVVSVPPTHRVGPRVPVIAWAGAAVGLVGIAAALFFAFRKPVAENRVLPDPNQREVFAANQPREAPAAAVAPPAAAAAPPAAEPPPVAAQTAAPAAAAAPPPPVVAARPEAAAAKPAAAAPPVLNSGSQGVASSAHAGAGKAARGEEPPAEVKADLDEARALLAKGDVDGALHVARRTLTVKKTSAAFALIATAYCQQGDLGNAKANFSSVSGADRARVIAACKKHDVDLK